jgi:hypothetical protein
MSDFFNREEKILFRIDGHLQKMISLLEQILSQLTPKPATKITIQFEGELPGMPATMTDLQSVSASISETDAAGQPVTFDPANITWSVNNPTIVALTQNPDGSASFKALAVGTTTVGVSDSGSGLSAQDTLTVTASAATALVISFGNPA